MTRIIKILTCTDGCPGHVNMICEAIRCRFAKIDRNGVTVSRPFTEDDPYPFIPAWCPLEQISPDITTYPELYKAMDERERGDQACAGGEVV